MELEVIGGELRTDVVIVGRWVVVVVVMGVSSGATVEMVGKTGI